MGIIIYICQEYIIRCVLSAKVWIIISMVLIECCTKSIPKMRKKNHWMVIHVYMNLLCTTIIQKFCEIWRDCTCGHDGWVGYLMLAVLYSIKWQIREFNQSFCLCRWQIDCDIMRILMWLRRVFDFYSIAHVSWFFFL